MTRFRIIWTFGPRASTLTEDVIAETGELAIKNTMWRHPDLAAGLPQNDVVAYPMGNGK